MLHFVTENINDKKILKDIKEVMIAFMNKH